MGTEGSTVLEPLSRWQGLPPLDATAVSATASRALPGRYTSVKDARDFTRDVLCGWGLEAEWDAVALVVSELVTNALRHGVPSAPVASGPEPPVRLHLMRWSSRLVCAVRDPGERAPEVRAAERPEDIDFAAESGRGLRLVDMFSDCWGWHPLSGTPHGKVVWALFRTDGPAA